MRLRDLPAVDELARQSDDPLAVEAARKVVARAREQIQRGNDPGDLGSQLKAELNSARAPHLRRVINATGVIVHTHLGRAPLAGQALERVSAVAAGYSNLEYDLGEGGRGSRALASSISTRPTRSPGSAPALISSRTRASADRAAETSKDRGAALASRSSPASSSTDGRSRSSTGEV